MKKRISMILILLMIFIVLMFQKGNYFTINEIEYNKCKYFNDDLIESSLQNLNYFSDSERLIKDIILGIPIVESVIVEKKFPNSVELDIIYKEPFLKVVDNNVVIITDENGYVLSINNDIDTDYYVTGLEISYYKINKKLEIYNQDILNNIFSMIKLINKSGIDIERRIEYNDDNVCIHTLVGIEAEFGDCSEIEKKFNNFINVYYDLVEKNVYYGIIDVGIVDLPLFRSDDNCR
jgi:cell division septal protein FtsQ